MIKYLKPFAIIIFGIIFPSFILYQAYTNILSLNDDVSYTTKLEDLPKYVNNAQNSLWKANDYSLFSLLYVEHANQKTMINKQIMKTSIVNIGFGVISVGMMLIILGLEGTGPSGLTGEVSYGAINFNLQIGSTGVGVFVIGAIVSTLGGVLKNDYNTAEIPLFEPEANIGILRKNKKSIEAYLECNRLPNSVEECFTQIFFQINEEQLK